MANVMDGTLSERLLWLISEQTKGKPTVFAKKAGIPHSTLYNYVEGRQPAAEHLIRIRDTYGVNLDWLLTGKGEPYLKSLEEGVALESDFQYNLPDPDLEAPPDQSESRLDEVLALARKVLASDNHQAAEALEKNIRYFAHAAAVEERLASMEERLGAVEELLEKKPP